MSNTHKFYASDVEAGLIERNQAMCDLVNISDYNNGCIVIAINLFFDKKLFTGPYNLLQNKKHLFIKYKLGKKKYLEKEARYHTCLAKEINCNEKVFIREFLFRTSVKINKQNIDSEILKYAKMYKKLIIDICYYDSEGKKDAHLMFCKYEESKVWFMDGQGSWPVLHKLELSYLNLISISISTYIEQN